ncbi:MAG: RNA polymerase sigma-70 factor [Bacteroidota bacterium]
MHDQPLTDAQLLERIKADDKLAFRQLFDRYYHYLLVTVNNVTGKPDLAKDAVQEVFFNFWKKRHTIDIRSGVKPYLRRAVLNRIFNIIKARKLDYMESTDLPEQVDLSDNPQTKLESSDLDKIIQAAIDQLPEKCRVVFILCRVEGLPHKEIAEKLNISTKTIENQMTKALKLLKKAIQPYVSRDVLSLLFLLFFH